MIKHTWKWGGTRVKRFTSGRDLKWEAEADGTLGALLLPKNASSTFGLGADSGCRNNDRALLGHLQATSHYQTTSSDSWLDMNVKPRITSNPCERNGRRADVEKRANDVMQVLLASDVPLKAWIRSLALSCSDCWWPETQSQTQVRASPLNDTLVEMVLDNLESTRLTSSAKG